MKKEFLILIAVIIMAGGYLFLHKEDQNTVKLPEIQKIDTSKITEMIIESSLGSIQFTKKEDNWVLTEKAFPADAASIQNMMDTFKSFRLTALVSEKTDLQRYELDKKQRVNVKLLENNSSFFELSIGKTAPSYNHTFVMINGNKNIYHANGSFRSDFKKALDDFRDKKVFQFKEKSIKKISIDKDLNEKTVVAQEKKNKQNNTSISWVAEDGTSIDRQAVSGLLSKLSFLECERYAEDLKKEDLKNKKKLFAIHLENSDRMELILYKSKKQEAFIGTSSMSDYIFYLSQFNGKEITEEINKILGIETEKNSDN